MNAMILRGGRVIDPANGIDESRDVFIAGGKLAARLEAKQEKDARVISVEGLAVCPGLIDVHVHLREPGQSAKETIETGTKAAAAGGFTSVVAMPNTSPVADGASTIAWIKQRAAETGVVNVFPTGCISQGMKGEMLAPIGSLAKAGVVAISDDGNCVQNNELMRRALEYARMFDLPVMDHCQDYNMTAGGVMNEGYWSALLGLRGWPAAAEEMIILRNALLAELTGARVHCQHVTTAGGVRILREAKERGVPISGEVCPHHLALTDKCLQGYDTNFKMNPPLRTPRDVEALKQGIADGTIEILASDHAPHCAFEKEVEFDDAPFGILGLETQVGLFITELVETGVITLPEFVRKMTANPEKLLRLGRGTLAAGAPADITVIDPKRRWAVDKNRFQSKSRNTPFHGMELTGRSVLTIVSGRVVWDLDGRAGPAS
jgi:dihydroorotase